MTYTTTHDVILYGDGSYIEGSSATYSAQPFKFSGDALYFEKTEPVDTASMARLPDRFGYERTTVHTAELSAMITSLGWRRCGQWNIFVGDKNALFNALAHAFQINCT